MYTNCKNSNSSILYNIISVNRNGEAIKMRNKENKAERSEINRKCAITKRDRKNRSQRLTHLKRKSWGL